MNMHNIPAKKYEVNGQSSLDLQKWSQESCSY